MFSTAKLESPNSTGMFAKLEPPDTHATTNIKLNSPDTHKAFSPIDPKPMHTDKTLSFQQKSPSTHTPALNVLDDHDGEKHYSADTNIKHPKSKPGTLFSVVRSDPWTCLLLESRRDIIAANVGTALSSQLLCNSNYSYESSSGVPMSSGKGIDHQQQERVTSSAFTKCHLSIWPLQLQVEMWLKPFM